MKDVEARYRRGALTRGSRPALTGVSLELRTGEIVAVVGNSGSGKTTLGRIAAGLIQPSDGAVQRPAQAGMPSGVQMVFQDPASSLDPRWTVAAIVGEGLHATSAEERETRVRAALEQVQLGPELMQRLPHELSGGQRQRVAIARALAPAPRVIVADEPVSALDLPTQREIIALLARLARQADVSVLLVTHNFDVVEAVADRVAVIAEGRLVELATREEIMRAPQHPVSRRLIAAAATLEADAAGGYRLQRRSFHSSMHDQESA